jgi:hypothetical protein
VKKVRPNQPSERMNGSAMPIDQHRDAAARDHLGRDHGDTVGEPGAQVLRVSEIEDVTVRCSPR